MKNRYRLNKEILARSYRIWWWECYRNVVLVLAAVFAVSVLLLFLWPDGRAGCAFTAMLPITVSIYMFSQRFGSIRNMNKAFDLVYKDADPYISFDFKDRIEQVVQGRRTFIEYAQVRRLVNAPDMYVLAMSNRMFAAVMKDAFEKDASGAAPSPEDFPSFLSERVPGLKIRESRAR